MKQIKWNGVGMLSLLAAAFAASPIQAQSAISAPAKAELRDLGYIAQQAERPYLGVYPEGESDEGGIKLGDIVPGSPAEKAGLKAGDVIVAMNDRTIGNEEELREAIGSFAIGAKVKITFLRDGEKRRTSAKLAKAPEETAQAGEPDEAPVAAPVELSPAGPNPPANFQNDNSGYLGVQLQPSEEGASVLEVVDGSPAAKAGLQSGDVIVKVDGTDVESVEGLVEMVRAHHAGDAIRLTVERNGEQKRIRATLGARSGAMAGPIPGMPAPLKVEPKVAPKGEPKVASPKGEPPATAGPRGPARKAVPAERAAPAEADQTRREIEQMRQELNELRRKCEQQQRTIDAIRRALNGEPGPGSTSMASPGEGQMPALALRMPSKSVHVTLSKPVETATIAVPVLGGDGACVATDGACVATDGAGAGTGDDCCATGEACCSEPSTIAVATGVGAPQNGNHTIVFSVDGDHPQTLQLPVRQDGQHKLQFVVTQDGRVESLQALDDENGANQGHFFGAVQGKSNDEAGVPAKKAPAQTWKGQKVKVGASGKALPENVKVKTFKFAPQEPSFALPRKTEVKQLKLAPQKQAFDRTYKIQVENGALAKPVRVRTMTAMPGMGGGMAMPKERSLHGVKGQVKVSKSECSGSCSVHCPMNQGGSHGAAHGAIRVAGHPSGSGMHLQGPFTIIIDGNGCELRCEGQQHVSLSRGAAADDEEDEDGEEEEDEEGETATFELLDDGGDFQVEDEGAEFEIVGFDDDSGDTDVFVIDSSSASEDSEGCDCCSQEKQGDDSSCCEEDEHEDDDDSN